MVVTDDRTENANAATPEVLTFTATVPETNQLVSMTIQQADPGSTLSAILNNALAALEANVDKSEIQPFVIKDEAQAEAVAASLVEDKRQFNDIDATLRPFADAANKIHKRITGAIRDYQAYPAKRISVRSAAIADHERARREREAAEERRRAEAARIEDEERRKAEAKELEERARKEKRPDLRQRAEEIRNAPAREVSTAPRSYGGTTSKVAKGVSVKTDWAVTVVDEDALINAIGRPAAYREIAAAVKKEFGAKGDKFAAWILTKAAEMPQIPTSVVKPSVVDIKRVATATKGKINWPGVAIDEADKVTTRTR